MDTLKICSGCQKPLEANAPDGLCPECLLKAGLGTGVDLGPDSQAESGRIAFVAPSLEEVARLFPHVEILGFIGQGGMGAVYKARQKSLDRVVALKILPPGIGKDPAFAERFTREAKALARLNHPGVVTIYEFGQADGLFFFLMEFVDGMSLRHLLEVERISAREALAIVPQICDALQYAHDQGIVHRDIKPENILLDRQGRVKVADFGLAKLAEMDPGRVPLTPSLSPGGGEGGSALTDTGKVMGTPQYMAPEQRDHPTEVDHRADIYSLGVVFYQMLTGELPGKPIEAPSHKVQLDVRLDEVVLRALEKEPARRYQQVSQVRTAVVTIARNAPSESGESLPPPTGTPSPLPTGSAEPSIFSSGSTRFSVATAVLGALMILGAVGNFNFMFGLAKTAMLITGAIVLAAGCIGLALTMRAAQPRFSLAIAIFGALIGLGAIANFNFMFGVAKTAMLITGAIVLAAGCVGLALTMRDVQPRPTAAAVPLTATRGRLRAAVLVGVLVWLFVTGTVTLFTWIRPESWKVVAVISCPHSQAGRPMKEHFEFTATMIELIRSDVILGRVIDRLQVDERSGKLDERWGKRNLGLKLTKAQAMVLLKRRLDVRSEGGTLIQVGVFGKRPEEPEEAMDIANTFAEELRAFRIERHESPAEMLEMTLRFTPPDILLGLAAGLVLGLLAGGLVLWHGFWRRRSKASPVKTAVQIIATTAPPASGSAPAPPAARGAQPARFSRKAIAGACWAGLTLLAAIWLQILVGETVGSWRFMSTPAKLGFVLTEALFVVGFLAPLGTTILGWLAVAQIRRSAGRLCGLGLAIFDGLLFPLLALDAMIGWLWWTGTKLYLDFHINAGNLANPNYNNWRKPLHTSLIEHQVEVVCVLTLAAAGLLNLLLIRAVWRAMKKRPDGVTIQPLPAGRAREWPLPLVAVRNGQRVIHWPGLLLFAVLVVAVAVAVSLTFHLLLPVKGSLGLVAGLVAGFLLMAVKLRQSWTRPVEQLPRLDAPERSHAVWPWVLAAVGVVLLIPVVLLALFLFARDSSSVEAVRRALQAAEQARLAAVQSQPRARLSQGEMELVGVSFHPSTNQPWWRPDGSPASEGPFTSPAGQQELGSNLMTREFVFRSRGLPEDASAPTWQFDPPAAWAGGGSPNTNGQPAMGYHLLVAWLPKTARTVNIKAGVAMGSWETIVEKEVGGAARTSNVRGGIVARVMTFLDPVEKADQSTVVTVAYSAPSSPSAPQTEVIAIDNDGQTHASSETKISGASSLLHLVATFSNLPPSQIKQLRFQARPYEWVEFGDVALYPGAIFKRP